MKKQFLIIFSLVIMCSCCFVGCSRDNNETKIELSTTNYSDYIAFNIEYKDLYFNADNTYMYCTAIITTDNAIPDISFYNCKINFQLDLTSTLQWTTFGTGLNGNIVSTELSASGKSSSTMSLKAQYSSAVLMPPNSKTSAIMINSITGHVVLEG